MIIITGAGLSGLLTGYLLKKEGIPFKIIEARNRVGGRINTLYPTNGAPIEMGATWFTRDHIRLIDLLEELGLSFFEQSMESTVFYQASTASSAQRVQIPRQAPSFRISGGTSRLTNALLEKLDERDVLLEQSVKRIALKGNVVQVITDTTTFECEKAVLAIPPKLWAGKIAFEPQLPTELIHIAKQTQTWMEDSIKVAMTYDEPFWGHENKPGTLFSNIGPIMELYDHSNHERSRYALCGFINSNYQKLTYAARRESAINQMKNVFGSKAETFTLYKECVWSSEENTFLASDVFLSPHQNNGNPIFRRPIFHEKLFISSTESASHFPGYMEGAVLSANDIAERLIQLHND